ncbi:hypothetical protein ACOSP7_021130 [Xanthoceras sorbifolium]
MSLSQENDESKEAKEKENALFLAQQKPLELVNIQDFIKGLNIGVKKVDNIISFTKKHWDKNEESTSSSSKSTLVKWSTSKAKPTPFISKTTLVKGSTPKVHSTRQVKSQVPPNPKSHQSRQA